MMKSIWKAAAAVALTSVFSIAHAVPTLQLGILGATYNTATETSDATSTTFTLYAFLTPGNGANVDVAALLADTYYISAALVPKTTPPGGTFGSFTFNGSTVNVTGDMIYGTPPLESGLAVTDPGDLASHGIYETYFKEFSFQFDSTKQYAPLDVQTNASLSGLTAGTGMYYVTFSVNVAGLLDLETNGIHFDLYSSAIAKCNENKDTCADIDVDDFAPFSHDAQSSSRITSSATPAGASSSSLVALGLGLLGFGFMRRRRQGV